jgi:hypothetical protein
MTPDAGYLHLRTMIRHSRNCEACNEPVTKLSGSQWVRLQFRPLQASRLFHKECWDQIELQKRIAWQRHARRTVYGAAGTMMRYPPPDNDSAWDEMVGNASSDVEAEELRRIRESIRRGRESFCAWERDHPLSRWHRFVAPSVAP